MLRRVTVGGAIVAFGWIGCAKGVEPLLEEGGEDATTSGAGGTTSTGSGGAGGSGGATAAGGQGGATAAGGAGGSGGATGQGGQDGGAEDAGADAAACSESPCKLVSPQCGCPANKACVATNLGTRSCIKEGQIGWGGKCGPVDYCEAGLQCLPKGVTSTCMKHCASDVDCQGPGGLCALPMLDKNGNELASVRFCTENCDPATNTGCPVAGTGCGIGQEDSGQMRFFSICVQSGKATQGGACQSSKDCAPTYGCVSSQGMGSQCTKWCDQGSPKCPGGTFCQPVQINGQDITLGNTTYGACL